MSKEFVCIKCSSKDVLVRHCEAIETRVLPQPECIACRCRRCQYRWTEPTADAVQNVFKQIKDAH